MQKILRRTKKSQKFPISETVADDFVDNLAISEFENCILYNLNNDDAFDFEPNELRAMFTGYLNRVKNSNRNDPIAHSKMALVALKMLAMLDKKATSAYPMLLQHHSGVNPKIIDSLLLPPFIDMQIAYDLKIYFHRRNERATYPSLIEEAAITSNSFSTRFGAQNSQMQKILHEF